MVMVVVVVVVMVKLGDQEVRKSGETRKLGSWIDRRKAGRRWHLDVHDVGV